MDRIVLRDVNWIGDGELDRAIGEGIEMFVRVRSTRPPQPAWLRAGDGRLRGRTGRGRGGRLARPGLRVLRRTIGTGARARRRIHQSARRRRSRAQMAAQLRPCAAHVRTNRASSKVIRAARGHGQQTSIARASTRPMTAGRRSTISCSERCSTRAGAPPSRRPTASAAACSTSASAPGCRCRIIRAAPDSAASTFPKACCARRRQRVRALRLANVETLAVMDAKTSRLPGSVLRRGGRAICHHRGAGSRSHAR